MGDSFYAAKDYERAVASYRSAYDMQQDARLLQKMGDASAALGSYQEALLYAQRAVDLDPQSGKLYVDLAMSYAALKRFDEAKAAIENARKLLTSKEELEDLAYVEEGLNDQIAKYKDRK